MPELIERKRSGEALSPAEIRGIMEGFLNGSITDAQMSAFGMAVYFQGMTHPETVALTEAMLDSGGRLSHTEGPRIVDKHSTGGIGDKTSLILAPLLASAGLRVPMISGRGLGITGGTLDKLESIPGFRTDLDEAAIAEQLESVGCVITGQTAELCPADRKLYALRDVTGTVPSRPLIVSSIMCKKLAESLDALVLDVKYGSGAFMKELTEAELLGREMAEVGNAMGVETSCVFSPMHEPLGAAVGNSLEVDEARACLAGGGPPDLRELVLRLAKPLVERDVALAEHLDDGRALSVFEAMVAAQGGDLEAFAAREPAPTIVALPAERSGVVRRMDAGTLGRVTWELGAGRSFPGEAINFAVGLDQLAKVGQHVETGASLGRIHAQTPEAAEVAVTKLASGIEIDD